ncbi:MAG TPA: hypothetical protein PLE99_16205 [Candidatus Thiothrix moscowensis]|uniref:hypothetical protein n=1 Tax=unclassified Thiothrix TaxID=2636184 RepID=UPI0025F640A2|nr:MULTISPECIES: hypothetical protein [unclassified Thiothrix]HRJ54304.1 hypothetical protein [Candidatus Thiothrix moscowensis]HRJ94509.1 hypothetical protein [Candidatus Thiothrix moscowensis]
MTIYQIDYIGCCGQEVSSRFVGDMAGLQHEITWIEERGGWGISIEEEGSGVMVYEDGEFVETTPIKT